MRHLADACALIDFLGNDNPDKEMPNAAPIMREQEIGVLAITVSEIARKIEMGKLPPLSSRPITQRLHEQSFQLVHMSWEDAQFAATLPQLHRDPMDRFLIATALRNDMTVITSDRIFQSYGVRTVW